jgi:hypothetical protein
MFALTLCLVRKELGGALLELGVLELLTRHSLLQGWLHLVEDIALVRRVAG